MKIKIIDFDEYETRKMKTKGRGGTRGLITTEDGLTYVVKPKNLSQTLNELVVQILLKSLGLDSIDCALVKILDTHYGALRYIPGLKLLGKKNFHTLNKIQKLEFLNHLFINYYLVNSDIMGEIYLTKDGRIVSLDYGEAGVDIPIYNIDKMAPEIQKVLLSVALN